MYVVTASGAGKGSTSATQSADDLLVRTTTGLATLGAWDWRLSRQSAAVVVTGTSEWALIAGAASWWWAAP